MKNVLITGASRGIGKAIAKRLSNENYNLIINYNKSEKEALELTNEIGKNCIAIKADVSRLCEVKNMFKKSKSIFGDIDILINCAGISLVSQFQDVSPEQWQHLFNVNINGVYNCISCAINPMIERKNGVILNISSIWAERGASCESVYAATKGAINALTKSLALELGPSNIRVNAIAPGPVSTDMMKSYSDDDIKLITEDIALNKIAQPNEIAELVSFLISDKNSYMTGQIITCDGGMCV